MAHDNDSIARSEERQQRITIAFLVLAWFFISLRIWTRTYVISNFGWDDSMMILAGMIFTVYCAALLFIEANGGGTHVTSVPQLQLLTKWVVISEATYVIAMMTLKISMGIFFARIVVKPWQLGLIYTNVGVNIFSSAAAFFYVLFRCGPDIDHYVEQQLLHRCTPRTLDRFMAYQQATVTTVTDLVFFTLPMFILWNANMCRRDKVSVGFVLSLAALGVVCSALRFRYVDALTEVYDFFWAAVNISAWSTIECGAGIIAGCLATIRPLVKRLFNSAYPSTTLGSCMKQVSRSFRSSNRSNGSSLPCHNSASSDVKSGVVTAKPGSRQVDEPTLLEFLAQPGEEVIALHDGTGNGRESTERILQQPGIDGIDFPWPAKTSDSRKRQTLHSSWTLRNGVASDGRTNN
ncbi:hypothetical protein DE146DRAFT_418454 [Phaeosphaeria sp. MPI-PUGE-AT-0046c]|nr:hypothetical protein DE146DRAFT_418454 [Phaeosphaeria sp. MPI-PUGE-AT-0046c]